MISDEMRRRTIEELNELRKRLKSGDESALEKLPSIGGWGNTVESVLRKISEVLEMLQTDAEELAQRIKKVDEEHVKDRHAKDYSLNPDFSDIRLIPIEEKDTGGVIIHGRWVKDHMEFYIKGWNWIYRNWVMFAHCLNHEAMHGVIGKILLEDNLNEKDTHFPFYAGMDMLFGWCYSHDHTDYITDIQLYEEARAFGFIPTKVFFHFLGGDD